MNVMLAFEISWVSLCVRKGSIRQVLAHTE